MATLEEAVRIMAKIQLGLNLTQEDTDDLVALLETFGSPVYEIEQ